MRPEDVVEGVVLHHHHHDVLDLRHLVAADRATGKRQRPRLADRGRCGAAAVVGADPVELLHPSSASAAPTRAPPRKFTTPRVTGIGRTYHPDRTGSPGTGTPGPVDRARRRDPVHGAMPHPQGDRRRLPSADGMSTFPHDPVRQTLGDEVAPRSHPVVAVLLGGVALLIAACSSDVPIRVTTEVPRPGRWYPLTSSGRVRWHHHRHWPLRGSRQRRPDSHRPGRIRAERRLQSDGHQDGPVRKQLELGATRPYRILGADQVHREHSRLDDDGVPSLRTSEASALRTWVTVPGEGTSTRQPTRLRPARRLASGHRLRCPGRGARMMRYRPSGTVSLR